MFAARSVHLENFIEPQPRRRPLGDLRSVHGRDLCLSGRRPGSGAGRHRPVGASGAGDAPPRSHLAARCARRRRPRARASTKFARAGRLLDCGSLRARTHRVLRARARRLSRPRSGGAGAHRGHRCHPLRAMKWPRAIVGELEVAVVDFLSADSLPWLSEAQKKMRAARAADRLPHSLLILSQPGLGAEQLAAWICALALCESRTAAAVRRLRIVRSAARGQPSGLAHRCVCSRRCPADQGRSDPRAHRDAVAVELSRRLQGRRSSRARSALNANGANAFLKTLEEPSGDTLLILVARPSHRLPATIASRCLRLKLRPPTRETALAWLAARDPAGGTWDAALTLAAGAPLMALELPAADIERLEQEMRRGPEAPGGGQRRCHGARRCLGEVRHEPQADVA